MRGIRFSVSPFARAIIVCGVIAGVLAVPRGAFAEGPPPPAVTVAHPLAKSVPRWDEYTGRFEPLQQVEVRPRVSGAVDTINFVDGQIVKTGDLLFVIDPRPYQIAVDSAQADVAKAQAQVEVAANDVTRAQQLAETRAITLRDVDQRKATLDVARAQQLSAEAALHNAELNLEWTQVRAPIPGRVSDHKIDIGNLVQGGQSGATLLTTIVTLDPIHFVFDASEADYIRYARLATAKERPSSRQFKNPVMVRLADEVDWSHSHAGVMDFVDNQLNARAGVIRGRAIFENKDLFLLPGTFGRLRLFGGNINALLIPDSTIASDQASKIVLTVNADNKVVPKTVTLGAMYQGLRVILAGLSENDRVVIEGIANPFVRPGAMVAPKEGAITLPAEAASN
ncbi:efflux RND transporter periplasmic adaptor subunit [Methylocella tundrae]|jgi:RND family efflux transporter MFP subunit|uniref:Efflux transporter, RND family, MFP subunit n=1 Tax=Methylocella tundrae TaxID=227605 RepID=A0A4U8Z306_METTU|nr:efflux RND transporter periplasmic adaptor subunit [Methylocella tundrae]WPP03571.1 efflux RND transporter periplasmic adaptor subunit [Methylocella tundrae]VFU09682.1 Efflux transporter, RND family, MFP subunit [Methylocella tundrae]